MISDGNARLASARRLTRRSDRRETGLFLAEGAPAVREAVAADAVVELFATTVALDRHPELTAGASEISEKAAAALSETSTPQGLVAVCRRPTAGLPANPHLVAVLVDPNDPGNLGTIIRTADAAGADAVLLVGGVDPYNGKAVRASAGSIFHLPVVSGELTDLAGTQVLATTGDGTAQLDDIDLTVPTAWVFGNEAHGLPGDVLAGADRTVRIPIYGRAESLNVAAAAAVCLYASARAQRRGVPGTTGSA